MTITVEETDRSLQIDVDRFSRQFSYVKNQLQRNLLTDERQLCLMTDESNKTIKYLDDLLNKGAQILQLSEMCKKYESEKDALACYLPMIKQERVAKVSKLNTTRSTRSTSSSFSSTSTELPLDDRVYPPIPSGYVKYKVKRPKTSYDERMEKRIQKSIERATEGLEREIDYTPTTRSYKSSKSRPQTFRRFVTSDTRRTDEDDTEIQFSFDYPFFDAYHQMKDLTNLWKSYNNVKLNIVELKNKKCHLMEENRHLRGMLRSILEAAALDKSGMSSKISTRLCSRYKNTTKSAPVQRCNA